MLNLRQLNRDREPTDALTYFSGPPLRTLLLESQRENRDEDEGEIVEEQRHSCSEYHSGGTINGARVMCAGHATKRESDLVAILCEVRRHMQSFLVTEC